MPILIILKKREGNIRYHLWCWSMALLCILNFLLIYVKSWIFLLFFFEISILVNDQNKTFNFLFIIFRLISVGKFQLAYLWFSILNFFYLFYKINETVKEEMLTLLEENYVDETLNSSNPISNKWNLLFLNVSKFTFLVKSPNIYPLLCALLFFKLN